MTPPDLRFARAALLVGVVVLSACGGGSESPAPAQSQPPAASSAPASGTSATVTGKGPVLKGGAPTIVILRPKRDQPLPTTGTPPVMDQIQLAFAPGILFTRPGQAAEFRNSDGEMHNIRVLDEVTKEPAFNVALPTGGTYTHTFEKEGFYDVGCDIHPGMSAVIITAKTPFVAVAGQGGQFSFTGVPAGDYTLSVYADVNKFERDVAVSGGTLDLGVIDN